MCVSKSGVPISGLLGAVMRLLCPLVLWGAVSGAGAQGIEQRVAWGSVDEKLTTLSKQVRALSVDSELVAGDGISGPAAEHTLSAREKMDEVISHGAHDHYQKCNCGLFNDCFQAFGGSMSAGRFRQGEDNHDGSRWNECYKSFPRCTFTVCHAAVADMVAMEAL